MTQSWPTEIAGYAPLVHAIAGRMLHYHDTSAKEDMIQAGYLGILRAWKKFDPGRGVKFSTYAVPWIAGEMRSVLRDSYAGKRMTADRKKLSEAERTLCASLGRPPTLSELGRAVGIEPEDAAILIHEMPVRVIHIEDQQETASDRLSAEEDFRIERAALSEAIEKLPAYARRLILLRYFRDKTQAETATLMGKSQSWISKAERRALTELKTLMEAGQ